MLRGIGRAISGFYGCLVYSLFIAFFVYLLMNVGWYAFLFAVVFVVVLGFFEQDHE